MLGITKNRKRQYIIVLNILIEWFLLVIISFSVKMQPQFSLKKVTLVL